MKGCKEYPLDLHVYKKIVLVAL